MAPLIPKQAGFPPLGPADLHLDAQPPAPLLLLLRGRHRVGQGGLGVVVAGVVEKVGENSPAFLGFIFTLNS